MNLRKAPGYKPLALSVCLVALLACGGCDKARVTVLFAANADPAKDNVPQEEIASLLVAGEVNAGGRFTADRVTLLPAEA